MSADNFLLIRKKGNMFQVYMGCASDEKQIPLESKPYATFNTLEEACEYCSNFQKNNIVEYGTNFDL